MLPFQSKDWKGGPRIAPRFSHLPIFMTDLRDDARYFYNSNVHSPLVVAYRRKAIT